MECGSQIKGFGPYRSSHQSAVMCVRMNTSIIEHASALLLCLVCGGSENWLLVI